MSKFWEFISGYKRFAIAAIALIGELGGLIPPQHQGKAIVAVAVLTAGTRIVDSINSDR